MQEERGADKPEDKPGDGAQEPEEEHAGTASHPDTRTDSDSVESSDTPSPPTCKICFQGPEQVMEPSDIMLLVMTGRAATSCAAGGSGVLDVPTPAASCILLPWRAEVYAHIQTHIHTEAVTHHTYTS